MMTDVMTEGLRLGEWLQDAARRLGAAGFEVPRVEASRLAESVLFERPAGLVLRASSRLSELDLERLEALLAGRLAGHPLQYLVGRAAFRTLDLQVGPGVFIPRPETEGLVQLALDWLRQEWTPAAPGSGPRIAEYGVGSGAILASLLAERPDAEGWGVELSPAALSWARRNVAVAGVGARVRLLEGDLDAPLGAAGAPRVDLIVSNPPYIPTEVIASLPAGVRDCEPRLALDGGAGGLAVIARIADAAPARLLPGGALFLEIDASHGPAVLDRLRAAGLREPAILPDDAGRPRYARAGARD